jgi:hypothetical protein
MLTYVDYCYETLLRAETILSAVAVPVLIFFGLLCTVGCGDLGTVASHQAALH